MIMLAYSTRAGLAHYIGGSGLAGEPRYTLAGRVWPHSAIVALAGVRRQKGRRAPPREERYGAELHDQRIRDMHDQRRRTGDHMPPLYNDQR